MPTNPNPENSDHLMQALISKLYGIITGEDKAIKIPRNKYVSWFLPGLAFAPQDFRYCARGFVGNTAEEVQEAYHQAFVLSSLVDYIPDISSGFITDQMQQTLYAGNGDRISSVYGDVLKYSKVVHRELSAAEKKKLKKFRDLLTVEVEEVDILTDEVRKVSKPGKLTVAYNDKLNEYLDVADELMNMKIDAMAASGNDPEAKRRVYNWNEKAKYVRKRLEAAEMAWVSQGYKREYEVINAYINQVTEKSLVLYKQDLQRKFEAGLRHSASDGDFMYATLLPGNFAASAGWNRFTFTNADFAAHSRQENNAWGGDAGVNLGLFSVGASAKGSKIQNSSDQSAEDFSAEFEFTQVPIARPWFDPGFFSMRSWTLDDNWDLSYDGQPVSDGGAQPNGRLVAYPVTALFVRNVKMHSRSWKSHTDFMDKKISGGGSVGYGPFRIGGSYSAGEQTRNSSYTLKDGTLTIPGLQLIGFVNHLIPKSPNPNPKLKPEDFVGGE